MLKKMALWFSRRPIVYYWFPPLAWVLLIFYVSAQPTLPSMPSGFLDTLAKKSAHVLEYAVLMVFLWRAFFWQMSLSLKLEARQRLIKALVFAFVLCVLYAASDEFHQTFVPGRQGRLLDVGVDSIGAMLATAWVWRSKRTKM